MKKTNSSISDSQVLKSLQPKKIIFPILIGLGMATYMLTKEFRPESLDHIDLTWASLFWLLFALLCMAIRDLGYIQRIRILSNYQLSWKKAFNIIMMWEFTSSITPSAIGGTSVAIFFVNREGLSVGRSSAMVMATSFLDELYFIIMFPLLLLGLSSSRLFLADPAASFVNEFFLFALIGYCLKFLYTLVVAYGLFINPRGLKWLLLLLFRFPIIRKWRFKALDIGTDLIRTSDAFKNQPFKFWLKAFWATFYSWTARYWVVNCLVLAFLGASFLPFGDHLLMFARQLVMWIMLLVSPTPGGSGFAEYVFSRYLGDLLPLGFAASLALIWRLVTYYPYLFIGAFFVPRWIKNKVLNSKS